MDKEHEAEVIEHCKKRMIKALGVAGIELTSSSSKYLASVLEEELKLILVKCSTDLPKVLDTRWRITAHNGKYVAGYHPINGQWYQIVQVNSNKGVKYYTNGIEETKNLKDADITRERSY